MIKIFNTLSGEKEPLPQPEAGKPLRLFVCGPTVYDYPHLGNIRTFMAFDIFVRYLRSRGIEINYLQNITDIDDKIIARAKAEGTTWDTIARKFEEIFYENLKALGIFDSVNTFARATDHIPEIVVQVKKLLEKGNAYLIEGDGYYFDLKSFSEYGKLSHRTAEAAEDATSRIDSSDKKRNKGDFCLWKLSTRDEPGWETELGYGRPGWHIEDTAITEKAFGPQYDIHGGALDLKFPHHEAEIAQQESASGLKPFVKLWMHAGFLLVNGQKMSKSLGNFITIEDILKKYSANTFRMMVLTHHYRSPLDYTETLAETARKNLSDILAFIAKLSIKAQGVPGNILPPSPDQYAPQFHEAMEDDLNTPKALAAIFGVMSAVGTQLFAMPQESRENLRKFVIESLNSLGIDTTLPIISEEAAKIALEREELRRNQQFVPSDALRNRLDDLGYSIEDTLAGPFLWPKHLR